MVVRLAQHTSEEVVPLQKFKENVSDLKQEDWVLLRFLRARNYDLVKAEEMIRHAIQWQEEVDLKNYLNWDFPSYYKTEMSFEYFGTDNEGAPCLWLHVGKWNGKVLVDNGEGENLLRWAWQIVERGMKLVAENDSRGFIIVDLAGLTYSQVTHIQSLKLFYQGCQRVEQCYPEIVKRVFIINTPWVFTLGWSLIKGTIERKTHEKIRIFGSNKNEWMSALLEVCPVDSIIPELRSDINGN